MWGRVQSGVLLAYDGRVRTYWAHAASGIALWVFAPLALAVSNDKDRLVRTSLLQEGKGPASG